MVLFKRVYKKKEFGEWLANWQQVLYDTKRLCNHRSFLQVLAAFPGNCLLMLYGHNSYTDVAVLDVADKL